MPRLFLLSPANAAGRRAQMLFHERAGFPLAQRLREGEAVELAEVFTFLSGLYFRGKITYARAFAIPPAGATGVYVITSNRGLLPADTLVTAADLRAFARTPIALEERAYRTPLLRDASRLASLPTEIVLLGSIATPKYVEPLLACFADRLLFPADFVGRGDMSRGGLLLRATADRQELNYVPVESALRHGPRPAKLQPRSAKKPAAG